MRRVLRIAAKSALVLLLVLLVAGVAVAGRAVWYFEYEIGLPDHHRVANVASTSICTNGSRTFVPLAQIPPAVRNAVLAAENPDFYARPPYNPFAEIVKAALADGKFSPGPQMSIALARCLALQSSPELRGGDWHVVSAITLYRLERDVPKDAILEAFLNEIWMGRGSRGMAAGADAYFGKSLADLTLGEAAFIAAVPKSPNTMTGSHLERAVQRRDRVLDRMVEMSVISATQANSAKQDELRIREAPAPI